MMTLALWSMFSGDINSLFFPDDSQIIIDSITVVILSIFAIDIILCIFFIPKYKFSYYFWFDLISTILIITEFILTFLNNFGMSVFSSNYL